MLVKLSIKNNKITAVKIEPESVKDGDRVVDFKHLDKEVQKLRLELMYELYKRIHDPWEGVDDCFEEWVNED